MVPVDNTLHGGYSYNYYSGCVGDVLMSRVIEGYECCNASDHHQANNYCLGSISSSPSVHHHHLLEAKPMAEEESRTKSSLDDAAPSSSKEARDERLEDEGWLQLGIGGGGRSISNDKKSDPERISYALDNSIKLAHHPEMNLVSSERQRDDGGLVELVLLPPGRVGLEQQSTPPPPIPIFQGSEFVITHPRQMTSPNFSLPFNYFQHPGSSSGSSFVPNSNQEIQWALRPTFVPANMITGSPPPPASTAAFNLMPFIGPYFPRPVMAGVDVGGSISDIRVVSAPRRSHSGIWFMLQASQNQTREPFLPQIPKSYLRIKDGRTTVRLLMKYLVNKLSLDSETEIEIRCRGQELQPCLTLQHVRDNIWSRRDVFSLLPPPDTSSPSTSSSLSPSTDHLMVLNYGRSAAAS